MPRRLSADPAPAPRPPNAERPPAGHATLDELTRWCLVGSGTTAEVWMAHQPSLRRDVAVKSFFTPARDEQTSRRFENECHALGEFSHHRGIVDVHLSGVDDHKRPFLMMRYYERGSLEDILARGGVLPAHEVVAIGRQIAGALTTLHAKGRQHRDVKPANILVSDTGDVVLGDFGISGGATDLAASRTYAMTPLHAAPEVIRSGGASAQADLWSLASTLYTALLGRAPFARTEVGDDSLVDLELRIMVDELPPLDHRRVPPDVTGVLAHALARDPDERTPSAQAFDAELAAVEQAHGWTSAALPAAALPPAPEQPRFDPSATGVAFGARAGDQSDHPDPRPASAAAAPSSATDDGNAARQATPRFDAAMTSTDAVVARDIRTPAPSDAEPATNRSTKKMLPLVGATVLVLLAGLSVYGAVVGSAHDNKSTGGSTPSSGPSVAATTGGTTPLAANVPSHVRAAVRGATVTVSWAGSPPQGAFGAVVSDGEHTWAATVTGHITLPKIPPGTQACYSVSWLLDAKGTTHYSVPACVNGAKVVGTK